MHFDPHRGFDQTLGAGIKLAACSFQRQGDSAKSLAVAGLGVGYSDPDLLGSSLLLVCFNVLQRL